MQTIKNEIDRLIKSSQEKASKTITEFLIKNSAEPLDEKEVKDVVMASLSVDVESKRFDSAFHGIYDYMQSHCAPVEIEDIKENWLHALDQFACALEDKKQVTEENVFTPLQNIIGLSEKTYTQFYEAGKNLYEQKLFDKAADVFFLLAFLNHSFYNVWISLGLCEQRCGHFELALKAFAMATITNIEAPEPFLHGAECCIEMGDRTEALLYLEEAMERIDKNPNYKSLKSHVKSLKSKC